MTGKSNNLTTPESDARQCALARSRLSALNHPLRHQHSFSCPELKGGFSARGLSVGNSADSFLLSNFPFGVRWREKWCGLACFHRNAATKDLVTRVVFHDERHANVQALSSDRQLWIYVQHHFIFFSFSMWSLRVSEMRRYTVPSESGSVGVVCRLMRPFYSRVNGRLTYCSRGWVQSRIPLCIRMCIPLGHFLWRS